MLMLQGHMNTADDTRPSDISLSGNRIRKARERAGLTQEELGKLIGKSQQTVNGYEHRRKPNITIYRRIAAACSVDESWLILGEQGGDTEQSVRQDQGQPSGRDPDGDKPPMDNSPLQLVAQAEEQSPLFAWTFQQATNFLGQESFDADFAYVFRYTKKLLRLIKDGSSEAEAKETILRAIELDRQEFRRQLNLFKDSLL